jgi:hypothetical protein
MIRTANFVIYSSYVIGAVSDIGHGAAVDAKAKAPLVGRRFG